MQFFRNIDENAEAPTKYGVRGIPTMLMFKNGEVVAQQVGAAPRSKLAAFIDQNI